MQAGVQKGDFAHVVGTFDMVGRTGTIDYVTPVTTAVESADIEDEGIHLVGEDEHKAQLFDKLVNPQRNSCAPNKRFGTFEEFVPVSSGLKTIRLMIEGATAAEFSRGAPIAAGAISMGAPDPNAPHQIPLKAAAATALAPGVSYAVQAKPSDSNVWQTLGVGLATPAANVDINQFPGARAIDVRVLQSDGFSEKEVFRDTKNF
jgi:hypothetical protein